MNANTRTKVTTPKFRVSFPQVFEAKSFKGGALKYSVVALFPKSADLTELQKIVMEALNEKWPDPSKRPANLKNPFRDGDAEKPDMDGYAGHVFVTLSSQDRPGVVDQNVQPIMSEEDFYAGCYAIATVTAYPYDNVNKGVALGLQNIKKVEEGDAFSGKATPEEDFGPATSSTTDGEAQVQKGSFDSMFK